MRSRSGFTLPEVMLGLSTVAVVTALSCASLVTANRQAVANRLYTLAQEVARDEVDRVQSVSPFNPQLTPPLGPQIPTELVLDSARGGPLVRSVPLYVDPATGATVVTAQVTLSVTDGGGFNSRAASVRVDYVYRGRSYQVQMNTLRTSDS